MNWTDNLLENIMDSYMNKYIKRVYHIMIRIPLLIESKYLNSIQIFKINRLVNCKCLLKSLEIAVATLQPRLT